MQSAHQSPRQCVTQAVACKRILKPSMHAALHHALARAPDAALSALDTNTIQLHSAATAMVSMLVSFIAKNIYI